MTLAQWCRADVYMPLIGYTRNPVLAVYATMLAIALWHSGSLSWLCWGLYHATGLVVFQQWNRLKRKWKLPTLSNALAVTASRVLTLAFVTASYSFLITQETGIYDGFRLLGKMIGISLPPLA